MAVWRRASVRAAASSHTASGVASDAMHAAAALAPAVAVNASPLPLPKYASETTAEKSTSFIDPK